MSYTVQELKLGTLGNTFDKDVEIRRNNELSISIKKINVSSTASVPQTVFSGLNTKYTPLLNNSYTTTLKAELGSLYFHHDKKYLEFVSEKTYTPFPTLASKIILTDVDEDKFNFVATIKPYSASSDLLNNPQHSNLPIHTRLPEELQVVVRESVDLPDTIISPIIIDPYGYDVIITLPYPLSPKTRYPLIFKRIDIDETYVSIKINTNLHFINNVKQYYLGKGETVTLYPCESGYFTASTTFDK